MLRQQGAWLRREPGNPVEIDGHRRSEGPWTEGEDLADAF